VNNQLTLQLIKARHRAYQHAVGELAPQTFIGNDMRHKLFQVDRACESKLDERCGFANAFGGIGVRAIIDSVPEASGQKSDRIANIQGALAQFAEIANDLKRS
jgi:hypothetical protein